MKEFRWLNSGFALRTRASGAQRYVVQYRVGTQTRRITLKAGITRKQAEQEWKKIVGKVAAGQDPYGDKKAAIAAASIGTFKAIADEFLLYQEKEKKRRASTIYATKLYLLNYCKPLHALKPDAIGRPLIAATLKDIAKHHGAVSSDRARAALSKMFGWAIGEGLCSDAYSNPVIGTNKRAPDVNDDSPARALEEAEIAAIWNAAGDDHFGKIVKLLFLTGCRRGEIAKLESAEVGDDVISLPGDRTKNHLRFNLPITDMISETIGPRPETPCRFVFGRRSSGFSGFSKAKRQLDATLKGVAPWRLHDIRHTVSTGMHEIGIEPHIVEACLNHVSGAKAGVAGLYNHAKYDDQKRDGLQRWGHHLSVLLAKASGANVTRLADRA